MASLVFENNTTKIKDGRKMTFSKRLSLSGLLCISVLLSGCNCLNDPIEPETYNKISAYASLCINDYASNSDKISSQNITYLSADDMTDLYISEYDLEFYYTIMPDLGITFEECPLCPENSIFDIWYGRNLNGEHVGFLTLNSHVDDTSAAPYVSANKSDYIVPELRPVPDHLKEYLELWFRVGYMGSKYHIDWGEFKTFANVSIYSFLTDEYNIAEDKYFTEDGSIDDMISTFGNIKFLQNYYDSVKDIANENDELAMQYLINKYIPSSLLYDASFYNEQGILLTDDMNEDSYTMYDNDRFYKKAVSMDSKNIKTAPSICRISQMNALDIYYAAEDTIFVNDTNDGYKITARTPSSNWDINDTVSNSAMYMMPNSKTYMFAAEYNDQTVSSYNEDIFDCPAGSLVEIIRLSDEQVIQHSIQPYTTIFSDDIDDFGLTITYDGMTYFNTSDSPIQISRVENTVSSELISDDTSLKIKKTYPVETRTIDAHDIICLGRGDYIFL